MKHPILSCEAEALLYEALHLPSMPDDARIILNINVIINGTVNQLFVGQEPLNTTPNDENE